MSASRKAGVELLRKVLVVLSSDEANTAEASKARVEFASRASRARALWAKETAATQRATRSKKTRSRATGKLLGSDGGKARSAGHPMREVELEFQRFYSDERRKAAWNRYSAGKFGRLMAKQYGVNGRHAAEQARKWARQHTEVQRAK